jgi:hypothetical protein
VRKVRMLTLENGYIYKMLFLDDCQCEYTLLDCYMCNVVMYVPTSYIQTRFAVPEIMVPRMSYYELKLCDVLFYVSESEGSMMTCNYYVLLYMKLLYICFVVTHRTLCNSHTHVVMLLFM